MTKKCTKCLQILPLSDFGKHYQKRKDGSITGDGIRSVCRRCSNLQRKECYQKNIITRLMMNAKARCRRDSLEFNLEYSDIILPEECPILKHPFIIGEGTNYKWTPTIDRIDSTKGYIKGNVRVISMMANKIKSNATKEELAIFAENIMNYFYSDDIV